MSIYETPSQMHAPRPHHTHICAQSRSQSLYESSAVPVNRLLSPSAHTNTSQCIRRPSSSSSNSTAPDQAFPLVSASAPPPIKSNHAPHILVSSPRYQPYPSFARPTPLSSARPYGSTAAHVPLSHSSGDQPGILPAQSPSGTAIQPIPSLPVQYIYAPAPAVRASTTKTQAVPCSQSAGPVFVSVTRGRRKSKT